MSLLDSMQWFLVYIKGVIPANGDVREELCEMFIQKHSQYKHPKISLERLVQCTYDKTSTFFTNDKKAYRKWVAQEWDVQLNALDCLVE